MVLLVTARYRGIAEMKDIAKGLRRDHAVVKAGLTYDMNYQEPLNSSIEASKIR